MNEEAAERSADDCVGEWIAPLILSPCYSLSLPFVLLLCPAYSLSHSIFLPQSAVTCEQQPLSNLKSNQISSVQLKSIQRNVIDVSDFGWLTRSLKFGSHSPPRHRANSHHPHRE